MLDKTTRKSEARENEAGFRPNEQRGNELQRCTGTAVQKRQLYSTNALYTKGQYGMTITVYDAIDTSVHVACYDSGVR